MKRVTFTFQYRPSGCGIESIIDVLPGVKILEQLLIAQCELELN